MARIYDLGGQPLPFQKGVRSSGERARAECAGREKVRQIFGRGGTRLSRIRRERTRD